MRVRARNVRTPPGTAGAYGPHRAILHSANWRVAPVLRGGRGSRRTRPCPARPPRRNSPTVQRSSRLVTRKTPLGTAAVVALVTVNAPAVVGFAQHTYHRWEISRPEYKGAYAIGR